MPELAGGRPDGVSGCPARVAHTHTTPHSLPRTNISIALLANRFDVKWVMDQVA